ncbi:proteophosphoglycan related [Cystoisospora suis]|uniref:Proteophosphoglycan related n=1 Tax=Cystoisospora suis TaxID=483139 RepID=A0A2C6KZ66_9APIC|nr:proteophosphoglycan related [Cystoisospora suis]
MEAPKSSPSPEKEQDRTEAPQSSPTQEEKQDRKEAPQSSPQEKKEKDKIDSRFIPPTSSQRIDPDRDASLFNPPYSPYRLPQKTFPSRQQMFDAVTSGDIERCRELRRWWNIPISTKAQPGYGDIFTTLQLAFITGQETLASLLLADSFTDVFIRSEPSGRTCLMVAAYHECSLGLLSLLLQRVTKGSFAAINAVDSAGKTALDNAVPDGKAYRLLRRYGALHGAELHLEKSLFGGIRAFSFSSFFSPEASTAAVTPGFCYIKTEGLYPSPPPGIDTHLTSPSLPATIASGRTSSPELDLFSRPVSSSPSRVEEILREEQEREERRRAGKDVDWEEELDLWRKFNREVSPAAWERMSPSRPDAAFQRKDKNTGSLSSRRTSSDGGRKRKAGGLGRLRIEQEETEDEIEQGAREEKENEEHRAKGVSRRKRRESLEESERDESDDEGRDRRRGSREKRRHRSLEDNGDRQGAREKGKGMRAKKDAPPRKSVDAQHVAKGKGTKQGDRGIRNEGDTRAKHKEGRRRSAASSPDAAGAKTSGMDQGRKKPRTKKAGEAVIMKKKAIPGDQGKNTIVKKKAMPAGPGEKQAGSGTGHDVTRKTEPSKAPPRDEDKAALVKKVQEELDRRGGRTKSGGGPPPPPQGKKKAVGSPPPPGSKTGAKNPAGPVGQKKVLSTPGKPPAKKSPKAVAAPHE